MQGRTILIVDDDADLVSLLVQAFSREGATVYAACDGQAGLKRFFEHQPDLVILDVLMPVMDGWQTSSRSRHVISPPQVQVSRCMRVPFSISSVLNSSLGNSTHALARAKASILPGTVR